MSWFDGFLLAVPAKDEGIVVLSWVEWPDKAARDAAMTRFQELRASEERFDPDRKPMPFAGRRMIFVVSETLVDIAP